MAFIIQRKEEISKLKRNSLHDKRKTEEWHVHGEEGLF